MSLLVTESAVRGLMFKVEDEVVCFNEAEGGLVGETRRQSYIESINLLHWIHQNEPQTPWVRG